MFRKLHLQLTALCTVITALVLAVLSVICLFISESGIRTQEYLAFLSSLNSMYQNLEQQTLLSHNWIRQMEYNHQFFLRISDNGIPLFFQSFHTSEIPQTLWEKAEEKALEDYGLNLHSAPLGVLSRHEEFTLKDSKELYNASVALIPRSGGFIGITVLQPLTRMENRIFRQRIAFLLADLTALILLSIFFWFFTGQMIRPLQENRKKQMQFVASASHELRSPLTVILSNITAVKNGVMPNDSQFLDAIDSEGKRMSRLISDMLQLAGADNHTWSIHLTNVELDTLLLQIWENYESIAAARNLRWEIVLPEDIVPPYPCDEERIRQLLSILIDNAFCYTPTDGCVKLSLTFDMPNYTGKYTKTEKPLPYKTSKYLYITVSDNGPGIPDDQKTAVFERFHRIEKSRTDKSHFGLGLCIAQEIAHLHHGQITLSDTPGGGAAFTVILPL